MTIIACCFLHEMIMTMINRCRHPPITIHLDHWPGLRKSCHWHRFPPRIPMALMSLFLVPKTMLWSLIIQTSAYLSRSRPFFHITTCFLVHVDVSDATSLISTSDLWIVGDILLFDLLTMSSSMHLSLILE